MEPIGLISGIAGILTAARGVYKFTEPYVVALGKDSSGVAHIVYTETNTTMVVLSSVGTHIRRLVDESKSSNMKYAGLVNIDQMIAVMTDGIIIFSELDRETKRLPAYDTLNPRLTAKEKVQWVWNESVFDPLLKRVATFKSSISLVLNILQSDSDYRAEKSRDELTAMVKTLLKDNENLSRRLDNVLNVVPTTSEQPLQSSSTEDLSGSTIASPAPSFQAQLESTVAYRRARRHNTDSSFGSSIAGSNAMSVFSGLSLSVTSAITAITLPILPKETSNPQHYETARASKPSQQRPSLISSPSQVTTRPSRSAYHDCLDIKARLLQIPGFPKWFQDATNTHAQSDPMAELMNVFSLGYPFLALYNEWAPKQGWDARSLTRVKNTQSNTSWVFKFLVACSFNPSFEKSYSFEVMDVFASDYYRFKKVLSAIAMVLDHSNVPSASPIPNGLGLQHNGSPPIGSNADATQPKSSVVAQKLIKDFLFGERVFVAQLLLVTELHAKIEKTGNVFPSEYREKLGEAFSPFPHLVNFHLEALLKFETTAFNPIPEQNWAEVVSVLLRHVDEHYVVVAANVEYTRTMLKESIEQLNELPGRKHDKDDVFECLKLYASPLEHLASYKLFIDEISDIEGLLTERQSSQMSEAKACMRSTLSEIDVSMKGAAELREVMRIVTLREPLVQDVGRLVARSTCEVSTSKTTQDCFAFLFDHAVIFLKPIQSLRKSLKQFRKRSLGDFVVGKKLEMMAMTYVTDMASVITHEHQAPTCEISWWNGVKTKKWTIRFFSRAEMTAWHDILIPKIGTHASATKS